MNPIQFCDQFRALRYNALKTVKSNITALANRKMLRLSMSVDIHINIISLNELVNCKKSIDVDSIKHISSLDPSRKFRFSCNVHLPSIKKINIDKLE